MYDEYSVIFAYIIGIIILFLLRKYLIIAMKVVWKLAFSMFLGGIVILIINFAGSLFNFNIALNPLTAFLAGFFGVPGLIMMIAIKYILLF